MHYAVGMKTAPFSLRLDPDLKAVLQALADRDDRSLSNYVERILREVAQARRPQLQRAE